MKFLIIFLLITMGIPTVLALLRIGANEMQMKLALIYSGVVTASVVLFTSVILYCF